jgi:hypothetical protein
MKLFVISLLALSSCTRNDDFTGKWVSTNPAPYYNDTLLISRTDSGLICQMHHGKYQVKQYRINANNSFHTKFMVGCFPFDLTQTLSYSPETEVLSASIVNNHPKESKPQVTAYRRQLGK